jgi:hypothetical protein
MTTARTSDFASMALAFTAACMAIFLAAPTQAIAFECPVAHARTNSSVIRETPSQIAELSNALEADQTGNTTIDTILELKRRYPQAPFEEIVNYMVTAYCPIVAKNASLSDDEKEARLKRYAERVADLAVQ